MYVPKYLKILEDEQIQENELPVEILRELKGLKMQVNVTKNLADDDPKVISMKAKDENLCNMINAWLDEEVEPPVEEKPKEEAPKAEEKTEEKPAVETPETKPAVEEPPSEEKPAQEAPKAEEKPAQEAPKAEEKPAQEAPKAEEKPAAEDIPASSEAPKAEETPPANPDAEKIAAIKSNLNKNRIHVNKLTEILGHKPSYPQHNMNGLKLRRVFMNSSMYEIVK